MEQALREKVPWANSRAEEYVMAAVPVLHLAEGDASAPSRGRQEEAGEVAAIISAIPGKILKLPP